MSRDLPPLIRPMASLVLRTDERKINMSTQLLPTPPTHPGDAAKHHRCAQHQEWRYIMGLELRILHAQSKDRNGLLRSFFAE